MTSTTPDIATILGEALEIEADDAREAYLQRVCGDDVVLRGRIDELLADHVAAGDFLDRPMAVLAPTALTTVHATVGSRIGPYKLLEQIGEGGMGVVYVAEQTEPIRRRVALKIIKPGMDSRQVVARFEAERQALALMDHPNIATVLDAGVSDAGLPYFVMELVRGLPITAYCDAAKLTLDQRIELFIAVCQAVQHAHQKGIIHRDLKPSNVMVTLHSGRPVPKVIDFGVAKAIGPQLSNHTVYTGFMQLIGTPLYMSPEQADLSAVDIDTRSDVYSLGVLLYELLTGRTPFDAETLLSRGLDEMRRIIREQEPPRLSHRISTFNAADISTISSQRNLDDRQLQQELTGELDWIVMKALEKDRDRRYESASALAADLQRYLGDELVLACPPSVGYRLSKLIHRNRLTFAGGALAVVLMLTSILGLSVTNSILSEAKRRTDDALNEARTNAEIATARTQEAVAATAAAQASEKQAQEEQRLAEQHYRRSLEIVQSLVASMSEWKLSEQPGMERYRLQLLESARDALTLMHTPGRVDRQLVELRIQVLSAIATDYRSMQRHEEAALAFRTASRYADELASQLESDGQEYRVLQWSLRYQLMVSLQTLGQYDDALREIKIAIQLAENQLKERKEDHTLQLSLCNMLGGLSVLENDVGNTVASYEALKREGRLLGFDLSDDLQLMEPVTPAQLKSLLSRQFAHDTVRAYFLYLAQRQQHPEIRAALLKEALSIGRRQLQSEGTRDRRFQQAYDLEFAAGLLSTFEGGGSDQAVTYLREALPLLENLVADFPALTLYRSALCRTNAALLSNLLALKRFDEAAAIADSLAERYPGDPLIDEKLGTYFAERGQDAQQALKYYDRMIASAGEQASAHHYRLRGRFLADRMNDTVHALEDYDRAFALEPRPDVYWFSERAEILNSVGRRDEAIAFLDGVSPRSAIEFFDRAKGYHQLNEAAKEFADLNRAIELRPDLPYRHKRRALCHFRLGHFGDALDDLSTGLELQPDDVSLLTWIELPLVAGCPDAGFRDGIRRLADRCVELNHQSLASLLARAEVRLALEDFQQAGEDFDAALKAPEAGVPVYYRAALLALSRGDRSRYHDLCRDILEKTHKSTTPEDHSFAAWTCSLAPKALHDYAPAVALAEQAVAATTPVERWNLAALGAVLLRSGNAKRALEVLQQAHERPATSKTSPAYSVYLEALALQQLGRAEEAAERLTAANALAKQELSNPNTLPSWNRRQTLELLREEAEGAITPRDKLPPAD